MAVELARLDHPPDPRHDRPRYLALLVASERALGGDSIGFDKILVYHKNDLIFALGSFLVVVLIFADF